MRSRRRSGLIREIPRERLPVCHRRRHRRYFPIDIGLLRASHREHVDAPRAPLDLDLAKRPRHEAGVEAARSGIDVGFFDQQRHAFWRRGGCGAQGVDDLDRAKVTCSVEDVAPVDMQAALEAVGLEVAAEQGESPRVSGWQGPIGYAGDRCGTSTCSTLGPDVMMPFPEDPMTPRFSFSRLTTLVACLVAVFAPRLALADTTLSVQGRLSGVGGGPVADGNYAMAVGVYAAATGGKPLYVEKFIAIPVTQGLFAFTLGEDGAQTLNASMFASGEAKFVGVQVSADPELTRVALRAVPYALHAATAGDLACTGCVGTVELATGSVTADKLATGAVKAQHVEFAYAGSDQKGGSAVHALTADAAKNAESAKFAGSAKNADTATTAEEANSAKKLQCTGCVTAAMLAATVPKDLGLALTKDLKPVASSGAFQDLAGPLAAHLDFAGFQAKRFRFENAETAPAPCDAKAIGMAWYNTATQSLLVCNGKEYVVFAKALPPPGPGSESNPAATCNAVLAADANAKSGVYWLVMGKAAKFQAWCDMALAGGGWTLALNLDTSDGHIMWWANPLWTNATVKGTPGLTTGDFKSEAWNQYGAAKEVLLVVHEQGAVKGWKRWAKADAKSLAELMAAGDNVVLGAKVLEASTAGIWDKERLVRTSTVLHVNHCLVQGSECTSGDGGSSDGDRIGSNEGTPAGNDGGGLGNWHDMGYCCSGKAYGSGKSCNGQAFRTTSEAQAGWTSTDQHGAFGSDSFAPMTGTQNDSNCGNANWAKKSGVDYDYALFLGK